MSDPRPHRRPSRCAPLRARCSARPDLPDDQAAVTADVLVWADLRGHPSHGVMRVPLYTGWIDNGLINAARAPEGGAAQRRGGEDRRRGRDRARPR